MSVAAIAIAVTRKLIHDSWQLGGSFVRGHLDRLRHPLLGELFFRKNRGENVTFGGRLSVKRWKLCLLVNKLGLSEGRDAEQGRESEKGFHEDSFYNIREQEMGNG